MNTSEHSLPIGQKLAEKFERFGLTTYASRLPSDITNLSLLVGGDVEHEMAVETELQALPSVEQVSDFHCVTSWSVQNLHWSGVRFSDFYHQIVLPKIKPLEGAQYVIFTAKDGYRSCMLLDDVLAEDVLLAQSLNGESLGVEHGAPLRLVAPAHYGYKNIKHITAIAFCRDRSSYKFPSPYPALMDHPRARVAFEERAKFIPGWLIRYVYRALIGVTRAAFRKGTAKYYAKNSQADKRS